jgi:O-acetyl-ADP-ribose deacetylase (regulator of RNase III)
MEHTATLANGRRIRLLDGDITKVPADAIVNAANSALAGGGGVDGAIHSAGGPQIMRELDALRRSIGRLEAGSAVVTGAGKLPARWVIHAVGPVYHGGHAHEAETLASCYHTALRLAEERGARSISFPSISTGVYGYPHTGAARVALGVVAGFLAEGAVTVEEAIFVVWGHAAYADYEVLLLERFPRHAGA